MKKTIYFALIFTFFILQLTGCSNNNLNNNTNEDVNAKRLSTSTYTNSIEENTISNEIRIGAHDTNNYNEIELASFSTKLGGKDTPRSRNISITTSMLNETIVKNGETFSFCDTIGKPTADKGYEEADSFDANGNTVKTLGGRKLPS